MSIVEKASEISENNATIAKNQQRVYEAGVRAGLAQDPDYAEGYEDGHTQGLSDASGVIWEDLLSGEIPVGKAREADHAEEASHSANADRAALADRATEADHASTATNANHSENADQATEADHAATADNATHADRATNADNADRAALAGHATSATRANSAAKADKAGALEEVLSIEGGGTGANTVEGALGNLGLTGFAKIVAGSYTGTGTYGSNNKNSLTFPFVPKLVIISQRHAPTISGYAYPMILTQSTEYFGAAWGGKKASSDPHNYTHYGVYVSWNGTTVSWYSGNAECQFNIGAYTLTDTHAHNAIVYDYVAIG